MVQFSKAVEYFGQHTVLNRKLGKKAAKIDTRTLKLSDYMKTVPKAPRAYDPDNTNALFPQDSWGMMLNNQLGDCTFAAVGHIIEWWMRLAQKSKIVVPDSAILKGYEDVAGYDPSTGANDNGCVELDVLNYWRNTGVFGHKLSAFATVNAHSEQAIKQTNWLFGACYTGVQLPAAAQEFGDRWDLPAGQKLTGDWEPGSWGGHAVPIISYDDGVAAIVTWGKRVKVTWRFLDAYFDEVYAPLSLDWIAGNAAPNGFNIAALQDDLRALQWAQSATRKSA